MGKKQKQGEKEKKERKLDFLRLLNNLPWTSNSSTPLEALKIWFDL